MHTWFSLLSLGPISPIFAWEAIQAWRTAGNHRAGTLSTFSYRLCIRCCYQAQEKERWKQEHGPHLGVGKIMKNYLILYS